MGGTRGPIPKRIDVRVRRNKEGGEVTVAQAGGDWPAPMDPDETWHPTARLLWDTMLISGQTQFYEPTDWATAYFLCEVMSRELKPQFIGFREIPAEYEIVGDKSLMVSSGGQEPMQGVVPIKGASLSAIRAQMAVLMLNEGDRRRVQIELRKAQGSGPSESETIQAAIAQMQADMKDGPKDELAARRASSGGAP